MGDHKGLDIRGVAERLPHRHPFLLVDRVLEYEAGRRIVGLKNVTFNEDYFRGHFPGNPVMPGVLIIESLAQTAGLLIALESPVETPRPAYLVGVDQAKFRRPVLPGDTLHLEVELVRARGVYWRFKALARVGSERAAEAQLLLAVLSAGEVTR